MPLQNPKDSRLGEIAVVGLPFDKNSSYRRGPALAPPRIREALFSESANLWTENGIDLGSEERWHLLEDLRFDSAADALEQIQSRMTSLLQQKMRVIALGGDHSLTYPIIRAYAKFYNNLSLLHLDAHPDLYDEFEGNRYSHACPFARIMEGKLVSRLVQAGIRTLTGHQREQAQRFGVEIIEMKTIRRVHKLKFTGPVYLSLDLDCLDPAFAPGVSHHEPGGMSTREVLQIIQNLTGNLVGADIVEYNPERDLNGVTAMVAAKLLKEILGKMLQ